MPAFDEAGTLNSPVRTVDREGEMTSEVLKRLLNQSTMLDGEQNRSQFLPYKNV
jgi:hypothetical protein